MLAAASVDDKTRLWNVTDPAAPVRIGQPLGGLASYAIGLAFNPGGTLLAVGSADKTVRLWNLADPARPVLAGTPLHGPAGYVGTSVQPGREHPGRWCHRWQRVARGRRHPGQSGADSHPDRARRRGLLRRVHPLGQRDRRVE
jgi:hypothetical protein